VLLHRNYLPGNFYIPEITTIGVAYFLLEIGIVGGIADVALHVAP
jgi:hypothetical protein